MTDQELNIAIAEHCGWPNENGPTAAIYEVPNYACDLNAMHEAEKMLNATERNDYVVELSLVTVNGLALLAESKRCFDYACATAHQRADAFVRTIGKWKEQE